MYLAFYKLRDEPFRLTPDPRFLHLAEPHRAALTMLLEGVLSSKGLTVVTGPVGTGKTTLLHALLQIFCNRSFSKMPIASAYLFHPTFTRDEFLEALLAEFEVPCTSTSKPARLMALRQMLLEIQRRGGRVVLLVDEAHLLTAELLEEIRLLGDTDAHHVKLLQIVLCGQPELVTLLGRPELRALQQRIAGSCDLRALSQAETRAYIAERLYAAGLPGPSPFTSDSLRAIHGYTQGVPRLVNLVCDSCLSIGFRTQRQQIQPDIVEEAAISLGLAQFSMVAEKKSAPTQRPPLVATPKSAVDILIEAMQQGRMAARE